VRVLYSFPHTLGTPGISTTAYHQIEGLIAHGVTVDVVCTSLGRELPGARRVIQTLNIKGRRIPHRALGVYRAYAYHDWRAARTIERLKDEVDLVHTWPAGCVRTLTAARRNGVPGFREAPSAHTQTAYEDAAREAASVGIQLPPDHHHRYNARHLDRELREFDAADFLLVPSAYVEQTFVDRGFPSERLIRHQYGFDPRSFGGPARVATTNGGGLTALFVGRGEPNKGLHHALRAWIDSGAAEQGRLIVCGEILPAYRERISGLLAHPSVHELGFVADVGSVMRDADVLLLPSVTEGSALVTYEAQAAGCALLVSNAAGAECEHLKEGLVHAPGDVASLTEHLRNVDRDRALLHALRAGALANAEHLTWAAAGGRLVEAYAEGVQRSQHRKNGGAKA
jgi:glycosyltransferase involved in cell wall biosynthesis